MAEIFLTIFFISVLLFFLGTGIWVALSMIGVSAIGMMLFTSRPVGDAMATTIWGTSSSWTLTALPLFVWMGEILFRTKLSENLFKGLSPWMQKLPGGLIHVNVVGCALFAAISGSSAATVATVGKMSIPELRKRNYPEKILLGSLAGSGTPPAASGTAPESGTFFLLFSASSPPTRARTPPGAGSCPCPTSPCSGTVTHVLLSKNG